MKKLQKINLFKEMQKQIEMFRKASWMTNSSLSIILNKKREHKITP